MPSLTVPRPRVNPIRPRKQLEAVSVTAHFVSGATRQDILDGSAVLSIASGDPTDTDECAYWCLALYDGGRCVGFRLTKFGTGDVYDVPRSLDACTCGDGTFRPDRPGGCRHQQALRQVLPAVANAA